MVQSIRRYVNQFLGQGYRRRIRRFEKTVEVAQLSNLRGGSLPEFSPAITDIDTGKAGQAVQVPVIVIVPDVTTFPARDDKRLFVQQRLVIGERVQVIVEIRLLPFIGASGNLFHISSTL